MTCLNMHLRTEICKRDSAAATKANTIPAPAILMLYCAGRKIPREILVEVRMFFRSCLALVLTLATAAAQQTNSETQAGAQPAIPDTPAGRTFKAWFEAFNSGDRALMDAYLHKYDPSKSLDNEMQFRGMTGGFDLLQIVKSEPLHLEFLVKERRSDTKAFGN